ncbi:hypothetical protein [Halospeciosus flavus]|uniref:Uncharacterized protein n=1 Tax=Halospeciosus flavus TaxID=3032283 RepID=A0ABD5Z183_9EURY|nr:hypothetical protein [Halospeciosus flavus]
MDKDEIMTEIVTSYREYEEDDDIVSFDISVEEPYNHYGERGVVDIYVDQTHSDGGDPDDYIFEMTSDATLDAVTGANEILRQFQRMVKYFYEDDGHSFYHQDFRNPDRHPVSFCLVFAPTTRCVKHVFDNLELYAETAETTFLDSAAVKKRIGFYLDSGLGTKIAPLPVDSVNGNGFAHHTHQDPQLRRAVKNADIDYELPPRGDG